jgi:hypothetical protein
MLNHSKNRFHGMAIVSLLLAAASSALAQEARSISGWSRTVLPEASRAALREDMPRSYTAHTLDFEALRDALAQAPMEDNARAAALTMDVPMPDGSYSRFAVVESPVMAPELQAQYPEIRSYLAQGIDDPSAVARFDTSPTGFRGMIMNEGGTVFINPAIIGRSDLYISFNIRDTDSRRFSCGAGPDLWHAHGNAADLHGRTGAPRIPNVDDPLAGEVNINRVGPTRRQFRFAFCATGEFSERFGGATVPGTLAAINTLVTRINLVYESELAVRFVLVANNTNIIFTNPASDPFNGGDGMLLSQVQPVIDTNIGFSNYDIGHLGNGANGSGVAFLGVVCSGNKGGGVSSFGDNFDSVTTTGLIVHEMGHQFNAPHSFNGANGACGGNFDGSGAYEPGAGSTPMSYAGICSIDNIQADADLFFHAGTFNRIVSFLNSNSCSQNIATGNTAPTVNAGADVAIPANTPFRLNATGSDPNGDTLTFSWEELDLGTQAPLAAADDGVQPYARSMTPVSVPSRTFPTLSSLLGGGAVIGERLPTQNRFSTWRVTARDNRAGGGGVNTDDTIVRIVNTGAPFRVSFPNGGNQLAVSTTVTWDVAGTTAAPISTSTVRIELSADGGNTYPHLLAAAAPNNGSASVSLPAISTTQGRVRISATNSIYFDLSDANFTVTPVPTPTPFNLTAPANFATGVSITPTLTWNASTNVDSYDIIIDNDINLAPPNVYTTNVLTTSHVVPSGVLSGNTLYYWRIVARNIGATTPGNPNPSQFITVAPPPFCQGDANGDRLINFADITAVLANFGATYTPGSRGQGDSNNDGSVNFVDVTAVLASYGVTCPT